MYVLKYGNGGLAPDIYLVEMINNSPLWSTVTEDAKQFCSESLAMEIYHTLFDLGFYTGTISIEDVNG